MNKILKINEKELMQLINKKILEQTGINFKFYAGVHWDEFIDILIGKEKFSKEEIDKLVALDWLYEEDYSKYDNSLSPFDTHDDLCLSSNFFLFIIEKTFGQTSEVVKINELEDDVIFEISVPA